jgi:hypothetical protein
MGYESAFGGGLQDHGFDLRLGVDSADVVEHFLSMQVMTGDLGS